MASSITRTPLFPVEQAGHSLTAKMVHAIWEQPRLAIEARLDTLTGDDLRLAIENETIIHDAFLAECGPGVVDDYIVGTTGWHQAKAAYAILSDLLDFDTMGFGQLAL